MMDKAAGKMEVASILVLALVLVAVDPEQLPVPRLPLPIQLPALLGCVLCGVVAMNQVLHKKKPKAESIVVPDSAKAVSDSTVAPAAVKEPSNRAAVGKQVIPYKYFGVSAARRKLHVSSVRLDNADANSNGVEGSGRIDMVELCVQRDQDGWSVWRSVDDLRDLFETLRKEPGVAASIPALPSFITKSENATEVYDAASIKRHLSLISAWLQLLNETPSVRDRPELAMFLEDERSAHNAALSGILSPDILGERQRPVDPTAPVERQSSVGSVQRGADSSTRPAAESDAQETSANPPATAQATATPAPRKSMHQRIKEATKRAFGGKSKTKELAESTSFDDAASVSSMGSAADTAAESSIASSPQSEPVEVVEEVTYETWLREQQERLGFTGHDFDSFEFTDISDEIRSQFKDTGSNSGFTVRGPNYLKDKKKVHPGPALCRLISLESFAVDASKDGDRHDHVCSRDAVQRRIEAVLSLRDPPFLFVMNFQVPGNPPVSMVSIYALPPQYAREFGVVSRVPARFMNENSPIPRAPLPEPDEQYRVTIDLLREYASLPTTEAGRLALWGIETNEEVFDEESPNVEVVGSQESEVVQQELSIQQETSLLGHVSTVPSLQCPSADTTDFSTAEAGGDGSVYSLGNGSCTTGILTVTEEEGDTAAVDGTPSKQSRSKHSSSPASMFSKRYLKNLAKEALGRQREAERKAAEAAALAAQQQQKQQSASPATDMSGLVGSPSSPGDSSVASGYSYSTTASTVVLNGDGTSNSGTGEKKKKRFRFFKSIRKLMGVKSKSTSADGTTIVTSSTFSESGVVFDDDKSTGYASDSGFESDGDGAMSRASSVDGDSDFEGPSRPPRTPKAVEKPQQASLGIAEIAIASGASLSVTADSVTTSTTVAAAILSDSVTMTKPPIRKQSSNASQSSNATGATSAAASASSSWKMPSDITWPEPYDTGVFPPLDVRNRRFKLIPRIVDGPWIVRTAVRSQPAILGHKVVQRYFRGNGYVETDVHIGSSIIASNIVGICRGYAKHFICEIGVVLQGETDEELPEKLLSCITMVHPDPDLARSID